MGQLLENTLLGGVMILVAAALRRILRGRLSPNVALLLWAVCLARLLTPIPLTGPLSPYGPVIREAETAAWAERYEAPGPAVPGTAADATEPGAWGEENPAPARSFADALPAVWAALAALLAALAVWAWFRSRRRVRAVPLAGERPEGVLPARARLRIGRVPGAPLTFGVVRPDVVVTPGLQGKEYTYVLAHEAAHVRRGDNLWHYAAALAVCVHWFNPAVWLMAALIRRDVELACDRAVLRRLGPDRRAEYANAVISLAAPGGAAFSSGFIRRRTKERIVSIMKYKKITITGIVAAVLAVCAVAALALTPVVADRAEGKEFVLSEKGAGDIKSGELRYHITRAWTARDESQIPEGKFKPYCNVNLSLLEGDETDPIIGFWIQGGTPTFIRGDGSFDEGMYMIFVELEIKNLDCSSYVLGEGGGTLNDPYLFGGQYLLELTDAGNTRRTYWPDFYSFYGESFDAEAAGAYENYNAANACLAFRLEPGETRTVTLGFIISNDSGAPLPEPSAILARPVTGSSYGTETMLTPLPGITSSELREKLAEIRNEIGQLQTDIRDLQEEQ